MLSRLSQRIRQRRSRALEEEIQTTSPGPQVNPGSPEAARRHPVRQDETAGRHQNQDRRLVDRRARARRTRRAGPRLAAQDPRLAPGLEAALDLHRRAADLRQSDRRSACTQATRSPRPRRAGCRRPSRTCRTSRSAPRKAARSAAPSSPRRATSSSRPTIRRSNCGCCPRSPTCRRLRKAFQDGIDIHAMTASEMFGVPVKDMPADIRRRAKAINFGIIYGISAFGLANQLGIEREEAGAYIKKYFERFPGIRDYMEETSEFCRAQRLCADAVRPQVSLPGHQGVELRRCAPSTSAPRSMRACKAPPPTSSAAPWSAWRPRCRSQAQRADAAAGARRTDLRSAGQRSRQDASPVVKKVMEDAPHPAVSACRCRCRSMPAPPTTGTRRTERCSRNSLTVILKCAAKLRHEDARPSPSRLARSRLAPQSTG